MHFIWHVLNTWTFVKDDGTGVFFGATHREMVPIGQNEHHVRGA